MISERDRVVLNVSIRDRGLKRGMLGTVVHVYGDGEAYEVEFFDIAGATIAVETLRKDQVDTISSA